MDREYYEIERAGERPFDASLFVLATVIASREGHAIVNAGYKALATEGGTPVARQPEAHGRANSCSRATSTATSNTTRRAAR